MNFYKHHIGDYAQATAHLSFVEDAAYSRMLRKYYAEEQPLPVDIKAVQRLVGARTREERAAVETVLEEFFELEDDGWHNKRADIELGKANAQAEANRRVALEREARRKARSDDESSTNRADSGARIVDGGVHESLSSREPSQTPDSRHQTPDKPQASAVPDSGSSASAGDLSRALRSAGVLSNPMEPRLIALAAAGATPEQMTAAAAQAKDAKGPNARIPPAYVYAIVERWIAEPERSPVARDPNATAAEALRLLETRDAEARTA